MEQRNRQCAARPPVQPGDGHRGAITGVLWGTTLSAMSMTFSESFGGKVPVYRDDMARRRLQQKGDLYRQGGWWKLRWREEQIRADGSTSRGWSKPVWIGPADGPGGLTKKQAQRLAWENFLSRLDHNIRTPQ